MRTRASAKTEREQEQVVVTEVQEKEDIKSAAEKWVKEGRVVNPRFKDPPADTIARWKIFIESAYNHPNLLAHEDLQYIRDLFQFLGVFITYETSDLILEVEIGNSEDSSVHILQPYTAGMKVGDSLSSMFDSIDDFQVLPNLNAVVLRRYNIVQEMQTALWELVDFIWTYPEVLLYPKYNYVYDFLVTFGVSPDSITYEIYQTQIRRADMKYPASTLLLKLGVPEGKADGGGEYSVVALEEKEREIVEKMSDTVPYERRNGSSFSEDSGIGNCDSIIESPVGTAYDHDEGETNTPKKQIKVERTYSTHRPIVKNVTPISKAEDSGSEDDYDESGKPYKCPVCFKRYISKGNTNMHIRKHHPGTPLLPGSKGATFTALISCPYCPSAFTSATYVKNHITRLHPEISKKRLPVPLNKTLSSIKAKYSLRTGPPSRNFENQWTNKIANLTPNRLKSLQSSLKYQRNASVFRRTSTSEEEAMKIQFPDF